MLHLPTLLTQIAVILLAARGVGWLLRRFHQPQVVGEMIAGILLGPSLLGFVAPGTASSLFPEESLPYLAAVMTSQAGILVPFVTGAVLGLFLYSSLAPEGVDRTHFVLFMGTAMSITAFPVLARILDERRLSNTSIGTMALASAAFNDVAGWTILTVVVLLTRAPEVGISVATTLLGLVTFAAVLLLLVRPLLQRMADAFVRRGALRIHPSPAAVLTSPDV